MKQQHGFTLIEALIALLVLSIGLLGVAAMQLKSLQSAHAGYQRAAASLAAQDAQERLWAALDELVCPSASVVNGSDGDWYEQWSVFLPELDSHPVEDQGNCEFIITIAWSEGRFSEEETPRFSYAIRLPGT